MNATGQRKVLIVDDSADDLLVLGEILRPFYSVRAAADAALALEALRTERKPDCILLDVVMPEEDGLELCRRLRADPATSGIPIIFVTSRASEEDQALGFASGAVDYVVKPVSPYLLLARVDAHVELKVAREGIELQNQVLIENARLRDEVDQISRHDLKNPLMVILNVPDLLLRKPGITDEERRWLRMIQESARRMLEQINLSVDRYKMEKGTYALKPTSVDALGLARRIAAMHAEIGGKEIQFDFLIEGIPPVPGCPVFRRCRGASPLHDAVQPHEERRRSLRAGCTGFLEVHRAGSGENRHPQRPGGSRLHPGALLREVRHGGEDRRHGLGDLFRTTYCADSRG